MTRRLLAALVVSALLAGCSGGSDDSDPESEPSPSAAATLNPREPACAYLSSAERRALAGSRVDEVVATGGSGDSSQCRWQAADALVQVTSLPAREWAKTLPEVVAQLEKSGDLTSDQDERDLARAKKLLTRAGSFTDAQACAAFATLAEIGGAPKGATTTVTSVPITETEAGLSAQTCSAGELTSILYSVPGLKRTERTSAALTTALDAAQRRAVARR